MSNYALNLGPIQTPIRPKTLPKSPIRPQFRSISQTLAKNRSLNASVEAHDALDIEISRGDDVIRGFYDGINRRDLDSVEILIGEGCVYEDLIFAKPFVGKKAILEFFQKFTNLSTELRFVIDDISTEDSSAVGVTWHLEWQGKTFPFSKGCSFYRLQVLDGRRQIVYGRDIVEPAIKPGDLALVLIKGVTWLLQRFPKLADQL